MTTAMVKRVLFVGATSLIAEHVARRFAEEKAEICLVGRNLEKLHAIAKDLSIRGASKVNVVGCDLNQFEALPRAIKKSWALLGQVDACYIAQGVLGKKTEWESDGSKAQVVLDTNFTSPVLVVTELVNLALGHKIACRIIVLSSVAGDRGRQSNYLYGAAKAGVNTFLEGLRHRLAGSQVTVTTVKLGMVATPMTEGITSPLLANPANIALKLYRLSQKEKRVVYLPGFWRWVMWIIRSLPTAVFHRTKL